MIARAKQLFVARIPDGEGKIAPQALHARRAPSGIGLENQFRVRSVWPDRPAGALQLGDEFRPAIESRVRGNGGRIVGSSVLLGASIAELTPAQIRNLANDPAISKIHIDANVKATTTVAARRLAFAERFARGP